MAGKATAIVAESLPVFREGIVRMLQDDLGVGAVRTAGNLNDAFRLIRAVRPSLAVVDRDLLGHDALEALTAARQLSPETRILLLAIHFSDTDIVHASKAGVRGYALKSDAVHELCQTMKDVLAERTAFSRGVRKRLVTRDGPDPGKAGGASRIDELTEREIQVLRCIAQGLSVKEIATVLSGSARTIDRHRANLMAKLDVHDRVLLTHYAIREGLLSLWSNNASG